MHVGAVYFTSSLAILNLYHIKDLCLHCSGETEYNRLQMIQGQKDVALSDTGYQQAGLVAERLAGEKFHLAFSSDLSRAKKVENLS